MPSLEKKETATIAVICQLKNKPLQKDSNELQKDCSWKKNPDGSPLFSSRNYFSKNGMLFDLLEYKTKLYPPLPNQWLIDNNLDYSNPNLLNEDPDADGFTNLEEWQGSDPYQSPGDHSSDPNNPKSRPLLWTKLRCNSLHKNNYYFDFVGTYNNNSEEYFQLQPQSPIPDVNTQGKNILTTKIRYLKLGDKIAALPLNIFSYVEKKTTYKEIEYDISELTLKNFITGEYWTLVRKSTLHPQSTVISIIDSITFDYILKTPPQKITVQCGNSFELESLPLLDEGENSEKKETELYQLAELNNKKAILKRNGQSYYMPILIN